ncbi:MAG: GGDEF domain-containing protein [Mariprofundus sp.]|nr:GGDEF domain-containing protein [Mariprofundus sp.]
MMQSSAQLIPYIENKDRPVMQAGELQYAEPVYKGMMATVVLERFCHDENLMALPVVNKKMEPVGLVTRRKIVAVFGHRYAHELNRRKQVDILMEESAIMLDITTGIKKISLAMTDRNDCIAYDPAIITHLGKYVGLLSVISILKSMTDLRIAQALDSNPLTHLPGNNSINHEIDRRLQAGIPFVLAYLDLDWFKVFNDAYGYERGDRVILLVATLLRDCVTGVDFVGHVGGDDFVVLLEPAEWRSLIELMLARFQRESLLLYDAKDRERGYLLGENRQGEKMNFNLMSLSTAVVLCEKDTFKSHIELAEVAGEVKHQAKLVSGNSIVVNQRCYETEVSEGPRKA